MVSEQVKSTGGDEGSRGEIFHKILDSIIARYRNGERPAVEEYERQYPGLEKRLREIFPALAFLGNAQEAPSAAGRGADGVNHAEASSPTGVIEFPVRLGEYRILREVGRGGMGVVFEAEEERLGRRVALKVLPVHALMDRRKIERFQLEARAAAALQHPGIVPVYTVGEERGVHYYAMRLIEGDGLDAVIREVKRWKSGEAMCSQPDEPTERLGRARSSQLALQLLSDSTSRILRETWAVNASPRASPGPVSARPHSRGKTPPEYYRSVARIGWQVAVALAYAHGRGVLHRDIKPANLLLDGEGNAWITDFGLAKLADAASLTQTGEIVGTLRYMAPEVIEGKANPRSDIYSLGLTLYEFLTLEPAFDLEDQASIILAIKVDPPPAPRVRDPRIPLELEKIVLKAVQKDPMQRYRSALEMAADLERFVAGEPVLARLPGMRYRVGRRLRKHRRAVLAMVLLAGAVSGFGWVASRAHRPEGIQCMVAVDLDGDGLQDLVTANFRSNSVTLLRNEGGGVLSPESHIETGRSPGGLAGGDIDDDGDIDIVVSTFQSVGLTVLRNRGNGSFGRESLELGIPAVRVLLGDVDGDKDLDILASTRNHRIALLPNTGGGVFGPPQAFETVQYPCYLALEDLDGDGDGDLAVTGIAQQPVRNLAVHRNEGGKFGPPMTKDLGGIIGDIAAADFDGDHDKDLAVAPDAFDHVAIFWNDGRGGFPKSTKVALPTPTVSLVAVDFDKDGDIDLVTASGALGWAGVLENQGGMTFELKRRVEAGAHPGSLSVIDLDEDGNLDVAVGDWDTSDVTVFRNDGRGGLEKSDTVALSVWWKPRFLKKK